MTVDDSDKPDVRAVRRQRVLKAGKILMPGNLSVVDCAIRDMSETGARILTGHQMAIPNEFRLVVPMDNTMRDVKVVWRRGELIGVAFTSEPRRAPARKL